MLIRTLVAEEVRQNGFTHAITIDYADLVAKGAVLTGTFTLSSVLNGATIGKGVFVKEAFYVLETTFDGGATATLKLDVGYNLGSGTDDPDAYLDNYELHQDGTYVLAGDGNGAVFATLRTGHAFVETGTIEALFTVTGANLDALTQGKVHIFLSVVNGLDLV